MRCTRTIVLLAVAALCGASSASAGSDAATPTPTVCTQLPPPKLDFQFSASPAHPIVGDQVQLSFAVSGSGGIPQYTLSGAAPIFQGDTSPIHASQLGTVTYALMAAQAGIATLTLNVNYETAFGCVEQPFFQFVSATSPPFTVEVVQATPTPSPTTSPPSECCGDTDGDGMVSDAEVQACVPTITTGFVISPPSPCDCNHDGNVTVGEITVVIHNAVSGCPGTTPRTPTPTPTPTWTPTPTPTPTALVALCVGDCNADSAVTVDEIVRMVNIALNGETSPSSCPGIAQWCDSVPPVEINCVVTAVHNALNGCPAVPLVAARVR